MLLLALLPAIPAHPLPLIPIVRRRAPRPAKLRARPAIRTRIRAGLRLRLRRCDVRRVIGVVGGKVGLGYLLLGLLWLCGVEVLGADLEGGLEGGGGCLDGGLGVDDALGLGELLRGVQGAGAVELVHLLPVGLWGNLLLALLGLDLRLGEGVAVLGLWWRLGLRVWAGGYLGGLDGGGGGALFGLEFLDARFGFFEFLLHLLVFGELLGGRWGVGVRYHAVCLNAWFFAGQFGVVALALLVGAGVADGSGAVTLYNY